MSIDELIAEFRVRFDDASGGLLITEASLLTWITEGQLEVCRRSRVLSDSSFTVSIVAGTTAYDVPDCTIQVRRAKLALEESPLKFTSSRDMDEDVAGWESHTGTPTHIITDMDSDRFTLYPEPIVNDTLNLAVIREPDSITSTSLALEIPNRFHYGLVDWLLYRAYSVQDSDLESPKDSINHYQLFEQEFGPRSSAKDEIFNLRQRPYSNTDGFY